MKKNLLLIAIVILLAVVPFIVAKNGSFNGADNQVKDVITQIDPGYKPWFHSLWTPPSSEVESLLFAVQAALGAGFIGYFIGYSRGKSVQKEKSS
ncbi:MAG: energy-coupling factor ABC transporter substrate-binding protein [Bacillota bacterium]